MKRRFMAVMALLILLLVVPVAAQEEVTPEPTPDAGVVLDDTGTIVPSETAVPGDVATLQFFVDLLATVDDLNTDDNWLTVEALVGLIIGALTAGSVSGFIMYLNRHPQVITEAREAYQEHEAIRVLADALGKSLNTVERVAYYAAPGSVIYKQIDSIEDIADRITGEVDEEPDGETVYVNNNPSMEGMPVKVSDDPLRVRPSGYSLVYAGDVDQVGIGFDAVHGYVFSPLSALNGEIGFEQTVTLQPGTYTFIIEGTSDSPGKFPAGVMATVQLANGATVERLDPQEISNAAWDVKITTETSVDLTWLLLGQGNAPADSEVDGFTVSLLGVIDASGDSNITPDLTL